MSKLSLTQTESGTILCSIKGEDVKQWYNESARRYYVTFLKNSRIAEVFGRTRMFRSHFVWLLFNKHRAVPKGHVVHHKDCNRLNDDPDNLQLMTESEHLDHHKKDGSFSSGNWTGKSHSSETIERMSEIAKTRGNNGVWQGEKKCHFESTKKKMSDKAKGASNAAYRSDLDSKGVVKFYEDCGSIAATARHFGCSSTAVRNRIKGVV